MKKLISSNEKFFFIHPKNNKFYPMKKNFLYSSEKLISLDEKKKFLYLTEKFLLTKKTFLPPAEKKIQTSFFKEKKSAFYNWCFCLE